MQTVNRTSSGRQDRHNAIDFIAYAHSGLTARGERVQSDARVVNPVGEQSVSVTESIASVQSCTLELLRWAFHSAS